MARMAEVKEVITIKAKADLIYDPYCSLPGWFWAFDDPRFGRKAYGPFKTKKEAKAHAKGEK